MRLSEVLKVATHAKYDNGPCITYYSPDRPLYYTVKATGYIHDIPKELVQEELDSALWEPDGCYCTICHKHKKSLIGLVEHKRVKHGVIV